MAEAALAPPALEAARLSVVRGGRSILRDVSLRLPSGSLLGLLGPNGAGKSTLLKAAAGLLPYTGALTIAGRAAEGLDRRERARLVGYVPQHSALEAAIPVREVVAQGRFAHRGPWGAPSSADQEAVASALARTGTEALADRPFNRLSYGERRLVLLARALATGAPLLLLDEPTAALDVGHALAVVAVLRAIADAGAAVAVVLHQLNEAAGACDQAVLLAEGRVVASGTAAEVIAAAPVRRVYGVDLVPGAHFGFRVSEP